MNLKEKVEELSIQLKEYDEKLTQKDIDNQLAANKDSGLESVIEVTNKIQILSKIEQKKVDDLVNTNSQSESKHYLKKDKKYAKQLMRTDKSSLQNPKAKLPPTRAYKKARPLALKAHRARPIERQHQLKAQQVNSKI